MHPNIKCATPGPKDWTLVVTHKGIAQMVGRRVVMNMGAVAQSVRSMRQGYKSPTNENKDGGKMGGSVLNDDSADALKAQILVLEKIRNEKSKVFDNINNDITSPDLKEDDRLLLKSTLLKGLIAVLKSRIEIKYSYLKLLSLMTFFCFYSVSVIIQRNISGSYEVQSRWENHQM